MKRRVFFVSDRTGITAEALGNSLLTQFDGLEFERTSLRFIDTPEKAEQAVEQINAATDEQGLQCIVFVTLIDAPLRDILKRSRAMLMDFFNIFIEPLEKELKVHSSHTVGRLHGVHESADVDNAYKNRMNAINFTLSYDDGVGLQHYSKSDVILLGVSRCGKTPTCLYMAMQYGLFAANYPFTVEDMKNGKLPKELLANKNKIYGLTIDADRLHAIRSERRANSQYASLAQCRLELTELEEIFRREKIPYLNTSKLSIEEISATILVQMGLKRRDS